MSDVDYNPVVWVSLASTSGLSLISLGQPGLRSDLDEQVYTGGLTAVQQMLAGEVGGDTSRFIGGSHNNKTGRFLVKGTNEKELVGQFLLISSKGQTIAPELIDFYEQLVTIFAEETLQTEHFKRAEEFYISFGVNDVLKEFLDSIKKARRKVSIPLNENLFTSAVKEALENSINDYEYSPTLVKISELKGNYESLHNEIKSDQTNLFDDFTTDLVEFLTSEHPHALVMFPKVDSLKKELSKQLDSHVKHLKVEKALAETIQDFEINDLTGILEDFALHEVTRTNLYARLEDEILHKFIQEFPLLYLADPEIIGFHVAIENLNAKINDMYDLAGTLTRIAKDMFQGYPRDEELFLSFIRHFCNQFPTGLTSAAWKYIQILFKYITVETNIDVTDVLPKYKDQIPPSHFLNIEKMITKYKLTKVAPISFSIKRATDVLPFYRALLSTLGFGISTLISRISLGENNSLNFLNHSIDRFNKFSFELMKICFIFAVYSYLEDEKHKLDFTMAYPNELMIEGKLSPSSINIEWLNNLLITSNLAYIPKELHELESQLDTLQNEIGKELKDIEKYLSKNPSDIAKGYTLKHNKKEVVVLTNKANPTIEPILLDMQSEYQKISDQIEQELTKIQKTAQEFIDGNTPEKKLNDLRKNQSFLKRSEINLDKLIIKTKENLKKKYSDVDVKIEKQIENLSKNFFKQFFSSYNFLKADRKAFSRDEKDIFPDSSSTLSSVYSSIKDLFKKEDLVNLDNVGFYNFFSKNRILPPDLENDLLNSLIHQRSFPFLKEVKGSIKSSETKDIFKSYAEMLENHTNELIKNIYTSIGKVLGKDFFRSDPEIHFILRGKIAYPSIKLGSLINIEAVRSLKSLLDPYIEFESQEVDGSIISRIFAVIYDFNIDFNELNKIWSSKEWKLRKVLLLLSWRSFLNENRFFINLLQFSTDMYSVRVKESFNKILNQIEKNLIASGSN